MREQLAGPAGQARRRHCPRRAASRPDGGGARHGILCHRGVLTSGAANFSGDAQPPQGCSVSKEVSQPPWSCLTSFWVLDLLGDAQPPWGCANFWECPTALGMPNFFGDAQTPWTCLTSLGCPVSLRVQNLFGNAQPPQGYLTSSEMLKLLGDAQPSHEHVLKKKETSILWASKSPPGCPPSRSPLKGN